MSKELKIIPKVNAKTNQKFDETVGCLLLEKSENFSFTIEESDTFAPDKPKSLKPFSLGVSDVDYDRMTKYNQQVQNKEIKSYNKKAEAHKAEMASFDKKMKPKRDTVSWAWQVVGNGVKPHHVTHNQSFNKGINANTLYNFTFPKVLEGGGMAWLEVFTDTDPATGKIPYGMFVQAKGEPKIIRIEWTDQDYNPIPESTVVAFNSQLILHIYTSGMYGQDVEVNLFDKDVFSGDDPLNISKKEAFTREVVLKEVKPHEKGKYGVSGFLVSSNQSKAKGTVEGATVVQKIEIKVSIQSDWKTDAGGNLWIYPTVKALETGKVFDKIDRQKLHVHKNGISFDVPAIPTNNTPLMVGQVETNVAHFNHCRYDSIKLSEKGKAPIVVFDSNRSEDRIKKEIKIDIIAGKKTTNYIDFELKTEECVRKPQKHLEHEILITDYTNRVHKMIIDGSSKATHIKKDESELIKTEVKSTRSINYFGGAETKEQVEIVQNNGIIKVKKNQIEFDAFFNYDIDYSLGAASAFWGIWKYFWLPNLGDDKIYKIKGQVSSCAFDKPFLIQLYPDIKWSFAIGWNIDSTQLSSLRPSWDQKNTIEKYELKADKITKKVFGSRQKDANGAPTGERVLGGINDDTRKKINDKTLDTFKKTQGGTLEDKKSQDDATKGKLSTIVEILKETKFSLNANIYEDNDLKLTDDFIKNAFNSKLWVDIYKIVKRIAHAIDGKEDTLQDQAEGNKKMKAYLAENEFNKRVKHLTDALTRPPQEVELLYPKIALGGGWQYETIDGNEYPDLAGRAGLGYAITLDAKPFIGIDIKWHILDLLCRKHPLAYAVLAAVKGLLTAIGDNPDGVKLDFWVKGEINTLIKFKGNALSESQEILADADTHITAGIDIALKIDGKVIKGSYTAVGTVGVGAGTEVGLALATGMGYDKKGFWIQPRFVFDGIKLYFEAVAELKVKEMEVDEDGEVTEKEIMSVGDTFRGEITMLKKTFETDRLYLSS